MCVICISELQVYTIKQMTLPFFCINPFSCLIEGVLLCWQESSECLLNDSTPVLPCASHSHIWHIVYFLAGIKWTLKLTTHPCFLVGAILVPYWYVMLCNISMSCLCGSHSHVWLMVCCVMLAGIEWTLSNWRHTHSFLCEPFSCVGTPVSGSSPLQPEKCWPLWLCPLILASLTLLMPLLKVSGWEVEQ